jgi:NAD(P)-dependent dehydrogenase (short-subunit alcohol dehydrogenase family)
LIAAARTTTFCVTLRFLEKVARMNYRGPPFHTARADEERLPALQGKTAIVTGAGSDIARAVALLFAREGANVIVAGQDGAAGEETVAAIEAADGRACFFPGDGKDHQYHLGLAAFAKHRYGWLDIAVNNVWLSSPPALLAQISLKTWDEITAANLSGTFYAMRAQIPPMIEAGGGAIVNLASAPAAGAYRASLMGLVGLTKGIAVEYARQGVRANVVVPGRAEAELGNGDPTEELKFRTADRALNRADTVNEVAQVVLFLASSRSGSITGVCMPTAGG